MECVSVQPLHTAIVTGRALTMGSKPERSEGRLEQLTYIVQIYNLLYI